MITLGLIGGLGPETTIEYYRLLIQGYRERNEGTYPSIIVNSVDLKQLLEWMGVNELGKVTDYLSAEIQRLHDAGADVAALASNTPHIVFDELRQRSSIPLISIVESACDHVQSLGLQHVGLLGTRYTMTAQFYPKVFSESGVKLITPEPNEQAFIHEKYINELLNNQFLPETRTSILRVVDQMKERDGIEAVILGGTELPLLLRAEEHNGVRLLDTARIHVNALLSAM